MLHLWKISLTNIGINQMAKPTRSRKRAVVTEVTSESTPIDESVQESQLIDESVQESPVLEQPVEQPALVEYKVGL